MTTTPERSSLAGPVMAMVVVFWGFGPRRPRFEWIAGVTVWSAITVIQFGGGIVVFGAVAAVISRPPERVSLGGA